MSHDSDSAREAHDRVEVIIHILHRCAAELQRLECTPGLDLNYDVASEKLNALTAAKGLTRRAVDVLQVRFL